MLKILRIIIISAALLASAVTSFAADKPCYEAKAECVKYIRELAEQGNVAAQYNLGLMYRGGEGVAADNREAVRWYRLAAEQGDVKAQSNLGLMYEKGEGVAADNREAVRWYRKAAEQGDAKAQYNLGVIYYKGEGIAKDNREAVRWIRMAAEQGFSWAQYILGVMYSKGEGVPEDKTEAARWFRLVVKQGDADVQSTLEKYCSKNKESGECAEYDVRKRAKQGDANAEFTLGFMYAHGLLTGGDHESVRWYRKAAERGHAGAQYYLGRAYSTGKGVAADNREAVRWFRLAAEQGHAPAQYSLGIMYGKGDGVVQDSSESYIWILISKAGGDKHAQDALKTISWYDLLNLEEIKSAKRKATQRFEIIENRKNREQSSSNNSAQKDGGEFAVAKPPEQSDVAAEVFENTWRSVVVVKNNTWQGSGVIIRPNMIATNCHVIEGGNVVVYKPENRKINENVSFPAEVIHRNEKHDFCVLEVKGLWGIAAIIRKYRTLKIGENVYALGAPRGLDLSLSNGLISQLRTDGDIRYIQTDAAISPGSSGGGLFDKEGNFIGILTSKYADEQTEGIGFAIPADLVLKF